MPSPSFSTISSAASISGTSNITRPTVSTGDAMVMVIWTAFSDATLAGPSGWTLLGEIDLGNASNPSLHVYGKVVADAGTEPTTYSVTISGQAGGNNIGLGLVAAYSGALTAGTFPQVTTQRNSASTSIAIPSLTATSANTLRVAAYVGENNNNTNSYTPPAGWTERYDAGWNPTGFQMGLADVAVAASGATGTATATYTASAWTQVVTLLIASEAAGDTTAPTLTSPTGTGGVLVCSGSVSTNEGNGTLYAVATASATAPSAAQVKLGQDHTSAAALRVVSQAVSGTGVQNIASGAVSAGTRYWHYMHEDAATNQSTVSSSASFSVTGGADVTPPTLAGSITVGTVTSTSIEMSWPAGSDDTAVTSYEVSSNSGGAYTDVGLVLTHTFTGLTPSTSYGLRVRAKDAAANVSTPALSAAQSTSAPPGLTSSALKNNTGTLLTSAAAEAFVHNVTTGALVVKKTGLTSHASTGVITFTDAALAAATSYRVVWRLTATGAEGLETLTAA